MRLAWAVITLICARFGVVAWFDPLRNGDLPWQQWLGLHIVRTGRIPFTLGPEAFAANGAPWVPQEWALSIAVALAAGPAGFAVLAALAVVSAGAALGITGLAARRLGAGSLATAACVLCVALACAEAFGVRAQVFAWPFLAALMYVLRCVKGPGRWWIPVLAALWANVHASALLAPALVGAWTLGAAIEDGAFSKRVRGEALLTLGAALAVCATPLGLRLPVYAVTLFNSPIRHIIQEWQPSDLTAPSFFAGLLPLIAGACLLGVGRSRRWSELMLFAAAAWLGFTALRNIPICAFVIAPIVAERLSHAIRQSSRIDSVLREGPMTAMLCAGTLAGALAIAVSFSHASEYVRGTLPWRAVAIAAAEPGEHRLYCEDFAWCSVALEYPNLQEFIDGRCDPFPPDVWRQYEAVYELHDGWLNVIDRNGIDAVLTKPDRALALALAARSDWQTVYADAQFRLFMKRIPAHVAVRRAVRAAPPRPWLGGLPSNVRTTE